MNETNNKFLQQYKDCNAIIGSSLSPQGIRTYQKIGAYFKEKDHNIVKEAILENKKTGDLLKEVEYLWSSKENENILKKYNYSKIKI